MIRYACDLCKRQLDPGEDLRYVVKIDIQPAFDPDAASEDDDDRDHLQEIQDLLEQLECSDQNGDASGAGRQLRFDLCADCAKKFLQNPLGREAAGVVGFSKN